MSENEKSFFPFYYVFAAKGLQKFLLQGDKLRLMVGGSTLIENLAGDFFPSLLINMGLVKGEDYLCLFQAAGGIRLLFRKKEFAERLVRLVPAALSLHAPGLEFVQTSLEILPEGLAKTIEKAEQLLANRRNLLFPSYPVAGPLVDRCPRSGLPAVKNIFFGGDKELADEGMVARSRAVEQAADTLRSKALSPKEREQMPRLDFPTDFCDLSAGRERENIGIVHIDGNGLGLLVRHFFLKLQEEKRDNAFVAQAYSAFSQAIQTAANKAFQFAAAPLVEENRRAGRKYYSFRPLVCAGDDVTVVVRAADAFTFAGDFLSAFEKTSEEELAKIEGGDFFKDDSGVAKKLTACAGIVFVKKNFPFAQAYDLCESLCSFAKNKTDRKFSALAFWRVTTTASEEFKTILNRELTFADKDGSEDTKLLATMMPYVVKPSSQDCSFARFKDLLELKEAVKVMPRGSLRQLLSEMAWGKARTERNFARILEVNSKRKEENTGGSEKLKQLVAALERITGPSGESALFSAKFSEGNEEYVATPLHDAIELLSVERG